MSGSCKHQKRCGLSWLIFLFRSNQFTYDELYCLFCIYNTNASQYDVLYDAKAQKEHIATKTNFQ